jgi:hypothetical protein
MGLFVDILEMPDLTKKMAGNCPNTLFSAVMVVMARGDELAQYSEDDLRSSNPQEGLDEIHVAGLCLRARLASTQPGGTRALAWCISGIHGGDEQGRRLEKQWRAESDCFGHDRPRPG